MQPRVHGVASANSATTEGLHLAETCNFPSKIQFLFPYHPIIGSDMTCYQNSNEVFRNKGSHPPEIVCSAFSLHLVIQI
jgi:hypothetical protein